MWRHNAPVRRLLGALRPAAAALCILAAAAPGAKAENALADAPADALVIETAGGARSFTAELADSPAERRKGLMGRAHLPENHGMLFDFKNTARIVMWMKDTPLSLDMLFIGPAGRVLGVAENTVPYSTDLIPAPEGAVAVFEVLGGTAARAGITAGDRVRHALFQAADAAPEMQTVRGFAIGKTEVTIGAFRRFAEDTGFETQAEKDGFGLVYESGWTEKPGWSWKTPYGRPAHDDEPAVHVTFDEAAAYCVWAGKRLPKDAEWELAAYTETRAAPPAPFERGVTYLYPTGAAPQGANCLNDCGPLRPAADYAPLLNRGAGHARAASHPPGVNGLYDMAANVWEWTEDGGGGKAQKRTRGGSWWYGSGRMRAADRAYKPRGISAVYIGFRCARDAG